MQAPKRTNSACLGQTFFNSARNSILIQKVAEKDARFICPLSCLLDLDRWNKRWTFSNRKWTTMGFVRNQFCPFNRKLTGMQRTICAKFVPAWSSLMIDQLIITHDSLNKWYLAPNLEIAWANFFRAQRFMKSRVAQEISPPMQASVKIYLKGLKYGWSPPFEFDLWIHLLTLWTRSVQNWLGTDWLV